MPARPRTTVSVTAAAVALGALLTACGSSTPAPAAQATGRTEQAGATVPATRAPVPATAAPTTKAPSTPAGKPPTARPATARPLPFVADPWNRGYEFGFVWGAKRSGDTVTLTFDRAGMLLGAQAKAYYDAHPDEERFDFKILDDKSFTETLTVSASATVYGNQQLGPHDGSRLERLTLATLAARLRGDDTGKVAVWVRRSGDGAVTYLAEQYLP
jgi:hypothetical protein